MVVQSQHVVVGHRVGRSSTFQDARESPVSRIAVCGRQTTRDRGDHSVRGIVSPEGQRAGLRTRQTIVVAVIAISVIVSIRPRGVVLREPVLQIVGIRCPCRIQILNDRAISIRIVYEGELCNESGSAVVGLDREDLRCSVIAISNPKAVPVTHLGFAARVVPSVSCAVCLRILEDT